MNRRHGSYTFALVCIALLGSGCLLEDTEPRQRADRALESALEIDGVIFTTEGLEECTTLTFDQFGSLEPIELPPEVGATFPVLIPEAWRAVDTLGWGVQNNPSGDEVALWWIVDPNKWPPAPESIYVSLTEPASRVGFYYASLFDVLVEGLDADGNLVVSALGSLNIETGFNVWDPIEIDAGSNRITTVWITGGATATMVDDFKFCRLVSPQAAIQALIDEVESLASAGALRFWQKRSLLFKLRSALRHLDLGHPHIARLRLAAFVRQLEVFVHFGIVTAEQGDPLIDRANAIISELRSS